MAKVTQVDALDQSVLDMQLYSVYVARNRAVPDYTDGLKSVQRKIIYAMSRESNMRKFSKSSATVGTVMKDYHPHGDASIYKSMKTMTNWFECYMPLIDGQGNWGNFQGDNQAASRYTEARLTQFAIDVYNLEELKRNPNIVDWELNYTGDLKVPKVLPSKLPMLLINGSFGIAVGFKSEVPTHNINEVIDETVKLIDNPNHRVVLKPDHNMDCIIIEKKDSTFKKISDLGYGSYKVRGKIDVGEYKHKPALFIHSLPNMVYLSSVTDKIEDLIQKGVLTQICDLYENSKDDKLEYIIVLKKGTDPNYVKDVLYKFTQMETTERVNMDVLAGKQLVHTNYKEYLQNFIQFVRQTKLRLYRNKEQLLNTRNHALEFFILCVEYGLGDKILNLIKKSTADNDSDIVEGILKQVKKIAPTKHYTEMQIKKFINMPVKNFSKSSLVKNKAELKANLALLKEIHPKTDLMSLDDEIKEDLLALKAKYGCKRRCTIISDDEVSNIPKGTFRIVITDKNTIKKFSVDESIRFYKGEYITATVKIENTDNLVLYDEMGRVFSIPVHKIPLTPRGNVGTDIRTLNKRIVSPIIAVVREEMLNDFNNHNNFTMIILTKKGYIKKVKLTDFVNIPNNGLIYSKLKQGDFVKSISFIQNGNNNLFVYGDNKAICINANKLPVQRRNTIGIKAMSYDKADGLTMISKAKPEILIVTNNGYINKINSQVIKAKPTGKAGNRIINLTRGDKVNSILMVNNNDIVTIKTLNGDVEIPVSEIKEGSSISKGIKYSNIKSNIGVLVKKAI